MAKVICVALLFICAALASIQAAAIEAQKTYPGFINLGSTQVSRQSGDGVGASSIYTKTFHASTAWSTRNNAWKLCIDEMNGSLLTLGDATEGEALYKHLVQKGVTTGVFWTAGIRDQTEWFWHVLPQPTVLPATHFAWAPSEPRPDPYYDLAVLVKSTFSYNLQTQASSTMMNNRFICEVVSTSD